MPYEQAYQTQCDHHALVLGSRTSPVPELGRILMVEHPPIITITKRPEAASHVVASEARLKEQGVTLHQTDRGGDVTYHGPGQLVCYPIIDLNRAKLRIHDYIRLLENAIIDTLADYGIKSSTDPNATGVWINPKDNPTLHFENDQPAKIAAIGVRVRKWITLHGLSLNLNPNMAHYQLLVPCGLAGRPVTSVAQLLGESKSPTRAQLAGILYTNISDHLDQNIETFSETNG